MLDEIEDVLLGDAAAGSGAADLSEIDVVFASKLANQRGGADVGVCLLLFGQRQAVRALLFVRGRASGVGAVGWVRPAQVLPGRARRLRCLR